ncbi:MAG: hypothetical protein RL095_3320 [Verrucomicrobiota bacterium]|jgi:endonuclease/exonuclease/phosphatase family metal-dependent hydrolase
MSRCLRLSLLPLLVLLLGARAEKPVAGQEAPIQVSPAQIRIASYNLYNFKPGEAPRQFKTEVSRAATAAVIAEMNADILLISELGPDPSLAELQAELRLRHADYAFSSVVRGPDPTRHIAVLARFKPVEVGHVTDSKYRIQGQDQPVLRGFAHCVFQWSNGYKLHIVGAHLKSQLPHPLGQNDMRRYEARQLHYLVDDIMKADPKANILVMGDMNDSYDSAPIKEIQYRRYPDEKQLYDLRPFDGNNGAWTHYYDVQDSYSRIDYFFASWSLLPEIDLGKTFVHASPHWFIASDHRPIVTTLIPEDREDPERLKPFDNATRRNDKPQYGTLERFDGARKISDENRQEKAAEKKRQKDEKLKKAGDPAQD